MIEMNGKVALVTGAARGIGGATAQLLAELGARVIVADLAEESGKAHAATIGGEYARLDVADEAGWEAVVAGIAARHGRLDALVNAAGIFEVQSIANTTTALFTRMFQVNAMGTFLGMKHAAPLMERGGGGAMVNVSSTAGLIGTKGALAYTASKFAVRGMTKAAAVELAAKGIRVNSVHPGGVDTEMVRHMAGDLSALERQTPPPLGRIGQPVEVARLICFLASDASSYSTGAEFICDGGSTAL